MKMTKIMRSIALLIRINDILYFTCSVLKSHSKLGFIKTVKLDSMLHWKARALSHLIFIHYLRGYIFLFPFASQFPCSLAQTPSVLQRCYLKEKKPQAVLKLKLSIIEPMLKGSQELPKSKLIKSSKVNSDQMLFCRCVICLCFVFLYLFVFSLSPKSRSQIFCDTSSVRKNVKAMLAMAAINLPLYDFLCSFYTREP